MRIQYAASILLVLAVSVCAFSAPASAHPHNKLDVIVGPQPEFPKDTNTVARCEVRFDVSNYSIVEVKQVKCSHPAFCESARASVAEIIVRVTDNNGEEGPGNIRGAVFPLDYSFEDSGLFDSIYLNLAPMKVCDPAEQMF